VVTSEEGGETRFEPADKNITMCAAGGEEEDRIEGSDPASFSDR